MYTTYVLITGEQPAADLPMTSVIDLSGDCLGLCKLLNGAVDALVQKPWVSCIATLK